MSSIYYFLSVLSKVWSEKKIREIKIPKILAKNEEWLISGTRCFTTLNYYNFSSDQTQAFAGIYRLGPISKIESFYRWTQTWPHYLRRSTLLSTLKKMLHVSWNWNIFYQICPLLIGEELTFNGWYLLSCCSKLNLK